VPGVLFASRSQGEQDPRPFAAQPTHAADAT